jgi:hypothetical protein
MTDLLDIYRREAIERLAFLLWLGNLTTTENLVTYTWKDKVWYARRPESE